MRRRRGPQGPDIRDCTPTVVVADFKLMIDGGTLADKQINEVWKAIVINFERTAHAQGLAFAYTCEVGCTTPKKMQARIERSQLFVEYPPSVGAVDPHATSTGKPSTREKEESTNADAVGPPAGKDRP